MQQLATAKEQYKQKVSFRNGTRGLDNAMKFSMRFNRYRLQQHISSIPASNPANDAAVAGPSMSGRGAACVLQDGRVYLIPVAAGTARIYDPVTNSVSTPTGTFSAQPGGCVTLRDGRVFIIPYGSMVPKLYNPSTDTLTDVGTTALANFGPMTLMTNGSVFCNPYNGTTARIFNPNTNAITTPTGSYTGSFQSGGTVLLPDGRIFIVPYGITTARIVNASGSGFVTAGGTYPGGFGLFGGTLLKDGRVFCAPSQTAYGVIYNPYTNTTTNTASVFNSGSPGRFFGCALLPDGRVMMAPGRSNNVQIYDPETDTVSTISTDFGSGNDKSYGAVTLQDGRAMTVPYVGSNPIIVSGDFSAAGRAFDKQLALSPIVSHW